MTCGQCQGLEDLFDRKIAAKDLKHYRRKGPDKTTRILIEAIQAQTTSATTLLDIGGGVGAIQHELLTAGLDRATAVDASAAYIQAARDEATRQGHIDRVEYHHGDFVELARHIQPADVVTLDRVICCYHDMPALVKLSAARALTLYGLVYPRDAWWTRLGIAVINFFSWATRKKCRFFVHPATAVEAVLSDNDFERWYYRHTFLWQVAVYTRL